MASPVSLTNPLPIEEFNSEHLRDSITTALAGIDAGHGDAIFDVTKNSTGTTAGVIMVHRFDENWAVVVADRYHVEAKDNEFQVVLRRSW